MVFAICAGLRLARFNVMLDDPDRPAWASNFFVGMPAPAGAITVLLPIYASFLGLPRSARADLADAGLHARHRLADGVAAAGIFRQARRHAGAARTGRAADRVRRAVLCAAVRLSVGALTAGTLAYLASLPFGWLSYRGYERRSRESQGRSAAARHAFAADRWRISAVRRTAKIVRRASIEPHHAALRQARENAASLTRQARPAMAVGRRAVLASAAASLAAPALVRDARRRRAARRAQAAPRVFVGVVPARRISCAVGAPGRGAIGRPHPHRHLSVDGSSAASRRSCSIRRAMASPISSGRCRAKRPAAFRRSNCSNCRSCRRAARWSAPRRSRILPPKI